MTAITYTIYWHHPYRGYGSFYFKTSLTPQQATEEVAENLAWDFAEDDEDELEMTTYLDDLEVDVYEGVCLVRPLSPPLASFT